MQGDITIYVDCLYDNGTVLRTIPYLLPATAAGPSAPQPNEKYILDAKNDLSTLGLAWPPYEGIKFQVRLSRP